MTDTTTLWRAGGRGWATGLVALVNGLFVVWVLLKPVPRDPFVTVDNLAQLIGMLLGLALCAWPLGPRARGGSVPACSRSAHPGGSRRWNWPRGAALFLGLAILCQAVGQVIYTYDEDIRHQAILFPSWADAAYLCVYPCALVGILRLVRRPRSHATRARVLLDGLLLMVALVTASWFFILGPTVLQAGQTPFAAAVGAAYPLGDLLLMVCLLLLAGHAGDGRRRTVFGLLALALGTIVVTDSVYDYQLLHNGYATGGLLDVGWALGYSMLGLGARAQRHASRVATALGTAGASGGAPTHANAPAPTPSAPRLWRALLPYILVPAVLALALYTRQLHGDPRLETGVYLGGAALVGLVLLRQVVAMREMITLYANNDALNRANAQLETLATTDTLTNLPNRALLRARLDAALVVSRRTAAPLALLLLDLDRFKEVNDTLGHHIGDGLLAQVAARLTGVVRQGDTVARLGGDEFAVVLPTADAAGAVTVARAIRTAIEEPFVVEGQALTVGVSVGVAAFPVHGEDAALLLRHADVAMYAAKQGGLGQAVYDPTHDGYDASRLGLVGDLRQAIATGGFALHYQPKVDLASGRVCGVEALVRWPHPEQGLIPPDRFIPLAEQTGLIVPLTAWVLDEALRQCAAWAADGLEVAMAVNLSLRNLRDPQLCATIAATLARHDVAPGQLCLELTETVVMADAEGTQAVLTRLAEMGVRLAIDDFGTGYSSLAYLSRLPVDELKIDRSFVQRLASTAQDQTIVASTIGLGHSLGLSIVTEGVEDAHTLALLGQLGSDEAQGYYLSRPLPALEAEAWLRQALASGQRASA